MPKKATIHDIRVWLRRWASSPTNRFALAVGSLVYVGSARQPPKWIADVLAACDRRIAAPTFAPDGLYFLSASYAESWQLPAFAEQHTFGG